MKRLRASRIARLAAMVGLLLATPGCSLLLHKDREPATFYTLERTADAQAEFANPPPGVPETGLTLIVDVPVADAGFDSPRMMYVRQAHKLEYFARSLWVDTPARMLAPLILDAVVQGRGPIAAAMSSSSAAAGQLRLITEIVRLQQEFGDEPSRVRFTLRATLLDEATGLVLAAREFDESAMASSEDPYGGVVAANRVVNAVLVELADLCNSTAAARKPVLLPAPRAPR